MASSARFFSVTSSTVPINRTALPPSTKVRPRASTPRSSPSPSPTTRAPSAKASVAARHRAPRPPPTPGAAPPPPGPGREGIGRGRIERPPHGPVGPLPVVGVQPGEESVVVDPGVRREAEDLLAPGVPVEGARDGVEVEGAEPGGLRRQAQPVLALAELFLGPLALGYLAAGLLVEPCVVHRHGRPPDEGLGRLQVLGTVAPPRLGGDERDRPERAPARDHGHDHVRSESELL